MNKINRFDTLGIISSYFIVYMEMNSSREIRRKEKPLEFKEELRWFAKGFQQPNTKCAFSPATIDAFQAMIWDKPFDDLLPSYGMSFGML